MSWAEMVAPSGKDFMGQKDEGQKDGRGRVLCAGLADAAMPVMMDAVLIRQE